MGRSQKSEVRSQKSEVRRSTAAPLPGRRDASEAERSLRRVRRNAIRCQPSRAAYFDNVVRNEMERARCAVYASNDETLNRARHVAECRARIALRGGAQRVGSSDIRAALRRIAQMFISAITTNHDDACDETCFRLESMLAPLWNSDRLRTAVTAWAPHIALCIKRYARPKKHAILPSGTTLYHASTGIDPIGDRRTGDRVFFGVNDSWISLWYSREHCLNARVKTCPPYFLNIYKLKQPLPYNFHASNETGTTYDWHSTEHTACRTRACLNPQFALRSDHSANDDEWHPGELCLELTIPPGPLLQRLRFVRALGIDLTCLDAHAFADANAYDPRDALRIMVGQ